MVAIWMRTRPRIKILFVLQNLEQCGLWKEGRTYRYMTSQPFFPGTYHPEQHALGSASPEKDLIPYRIPFNSSDLVPDGEPCSYKL